MSSSTVSVSAGTPSPHPFFQKVDAIKPSKQDINQVIMDYLVREGYPRAAAKFSKEANIAAPVDEESIQLRVDIRHKIHRGDIETAVEKINDISPQILDDNPALHFALLRLHLIELIRTFNTTVPQDIAPVLQFAQAQLAPRASTDPSLLKDLEQAMSLLMHEPDKIPVELKVLFQPELRKQVAKDVNEAILISQGEQASSRLQNLVKLRVYAEKEARSANKDLPQHIPFGLESEDEEMGNGEVGDIMVS